MIQSEMKNQDTYNNGVLFGEEIHGNIMNERIRK